MTRGGFLAAILGAPMLGWATKLVGERNEVWVIEPVSQMTSQIKNNDSLVTAVFSTTTSTSVTATYWLDNTDSSGIWTYNY